VEIWQADHQGRYPHPADGRPVASDPSGSDTAIAGMTNIGGRQIALPPPNCFVRSRPQPTA
jgi:protocatechuate 3,4-dioxygenase beta subunit